MRTANLSTGNALTYGYDGLNRRVHKMDGATLKYHYIFEDGGRIAGHVNINGVIQREYIYGSDWRVPDYLVASSVNYFLVKDYLGSVRLVVKTDDGTVTQRLDYNDLGEAVTDTNAGFQAFGFAGGIYDGQTKFVKFGARDYDPRAAGRWTTKDPILFGGKDTNLFAYTFSDPLNFIDPTGLYGTSDCGYYKQSCQANGGFYECNIAPRVCPAFPSGKSGVGNVSSCMRQCLQEKHQDNMQNKNQCSENNQIGNGKNVSDHASCAASCMRNPENPYNPAGPSLPDGSPSLY